MPPELEIAVDRADIVRFARECKGARFVHEGRHPEVGLDCAGVPIWIWHRLGLPPIAPAGYGRSPRPRTMTAILEEHLQRIAPRDAGVADVLHMAWKEVPQHLAVITELAPVPRILHSCESLGGCSEHRYDSFWRARVRAAYRFPGVAA